VKLISWALSDVGSKRDHNEDSVLADDRLGLYAVADGMGGHQGGDRASQMAVEIVREKIGEVKDYDDAARRIFERERAEGLLPAYPIAPVPALGNGERDQPTMPPSSELLTDPDILARPPAAAAVLHAAARSAGRDIFDAAQHNPELAGMGTTLTALLFHGDRAYVTHVGDSRGFLFRDGHIEQLTEDHSWVAEQVRAGIMTEAEAAESGFKHIITRSVGFERDVDLDLLSVAVLPGDCYLLCSDGMSNYVSTEELGRLLTSTYYRQCPQLLVDLANERGGDDNITVVVVSVANDKS